MDRVVKTTVTSLERNHNRGRLFPRAVSMLFQNVQRLGGVGSGYFSC